MSFNLFIVGVGFFALFGVFFGTVAAWVAYDVETNDSVSESDLFMSFAVRECNATLKRIKEKQPGIELPPPIVYPKPKKTNEELFDVMYKEFFVPFWGITGIGAVVCGFFWLVDALTKCDFF